MTQANPKKSKVLKPITFRPKIDDRNALDVLTAKLKINQSRVLRSALKLMVEFEGVREQVEQRAHLLESSGRSAAW